MGRKGMEKKGARAPDGRPVKNHFPTGTVVLFVVLLAAVAVVSMVVKGLKPAVPDELAAVLRPAPRALQPIAFEDQSGRLYTLADLEGKWTFLFFGYTYCPDICPTTLAMLTSMLRTLEREPGADADVQVLFVSVDPARDTAETIGSYLAHFDDGFVGISADESTTRALAGQFDAMFFKEQVGDSGDYLVAHASSVYLVGPGAEYVAAFSPPHDPATIAAQFKRIRRLRS